MTDTPDDLARWAADLAADLGVPGDTPVGDLLTLTRDVAHGVMRPAGPITTYLVGLAVAGGMPIDQAAAIVRARIPEQE